MTWRGLREEDRRLDEAAGDEKNQQELAVPEAVGPFQLESGGKSKGASS